ncbi:MAG: hypothetical protein GC203_19385 [Phenylobacterium sp.]|uniref:hypothetical protein n=1 Tax=Phenylobacterium sp. TaxID=1871053 RepID=UPI0025D1C145|nr:hypothetical protein [Phenylobacterium sp.]MBI1200027.1 hypothetical protein [Phenylobacterium sp.]
MSRHRLALLPFALLAIAAAPAPKAPPKAEPKPAQTPVEVFDARDPRGLMSILDTAGAKAQTSQRDDDAVLVSVTSAVAAFSMQFVGCAGGRACKAVLFDSALEGAPTTAQINGFNQASAMCRVVQARAGGAHVLYSTLLFGTTTRADAVTHLAAWQGCLADARDFAKDPVRFLAEAA